MKNLFAVFFISFGYGSFFKISMAFAEEKKINLKDVKIQGEALNSPLSLSRKDRTDIEKHLKIRTDFREEILGDLPLFLKSKAKKRKKTP